MENNVEDFIEKCSERIAKHEKVSFVYGCDAIFGMNKVESVIEQILYAALDVVRTVNQLNPQYGFYITIKPQYEIDRYRVDFCINYHSPGGDIKKKVLVECDSQKYHERTEKERRYEKARDRYIKMQGYEILHYTGREIMENPFGVAKEIMQYATGISELCEESNLD